MVSILCEAASGTAPAIIAGSIVAGMGLLKGGEFAWGQIRRRNGGGNGKPGYTSACIDHVTRLRAVEVELKHAREGQARMEKKLDRVLERSA